MLVSILERVIEMMLTFSHPCDHRDEVDGSRRKEGGSTSIKNEDLRSRIWFPYGEA